MSSGENILIGIEASSAQNTVHRSHPIFRAETAA